jgi:hypothetical protein
MYHAAGVWNAYWGDRGENVDFDYTGFNNYGADIRIVLTEELSNPNWDMEVVNSGGGYGEIRVRPSVLNVTSPQWSAGLMIHEFGHMVGLDDVDCAYAYGSVMSRNGNGGFELTCGDVNSLNRVYRGDQSPILIDTDGNGFQCSSAPAGVMFDIRSNGVQTRVAWPTTPGDAFLALDRNGNGVIDDSSELFGNYTILPNGLPAAHGYQALAALDDDHDGDIDQADSAFSSLLLWSDAVRDGISAPGELVPLSQTAIVRLSTDPSDLNVIDYWGNWFPLWATVENSLSGVTMASVDVFLQTVDY